MRRELPKAFTLTEMLVVITIIGILIGLIMPAVNSARKTAQKTDCANRQRELALAVVRFESSKGSYPGYIQALPKSVNCYSATPYHLVVPWTVMILPELNRVDLWNDFRSPSGVPQMVSSSVAMVINAFRCPSDSQTSLRPLSYVANCGIQDQNLSSTSVTYTPDRATNGVFQHLYYFRNLQNTGDSSRLFYRLQDPSRVLRVSSTDIKDGVSNTILLSENCQAWQWCLGPTTETVPNAYAESLFGMVWWPPTYFTSNATASPRMINMYRTSADSSNYLTTSNYYWFARPSSNHENGVNVAFCDGHVVFLRENVAYPVFAQLMTPDGQNIADPISGNALINRSTYSAWYAAVPTGVVD